MNSNGFDRIAGESKIKAGNTKWREVVRFTERLNSGQQCYYCNFSLECGEQECIWRNDSA